MLAPVKVINPRVMTRQNSDKDQRQRKKPAARKSEPQALAPQSFDNTHIDITA